ncbi:hypothetical protein GCWU000342_00241 [Shuttleworthella satelles DSM 14600]|uniref:Uncharacterized protein n=1 Tax=Shuttleworthella satelles DSM 14600 TaxID=626523 RepID=C4G8E5_9FIRM|nr:hypothetical protein GCWU000342_00241 [Shuttleworthia satelles DSM 14600]
MRFDLAGRLKSLKTWRQKVFSCTGADRKVSGVAIYLGTEMELYYT